MELVKKSKKQCKKLKKLKQESTEKKLKTDTPCKGVDAKCSIQKKNNLICVNINKLNNKYKKNSCNNNSVKIFKNFRKKKLDVDNNLNEKSSALTENVKEETCNDKMTKVAAPVVKMVEPLLELIDFEEEIKVEKISKDKSTDIKFEYENFDYEKEIEKNTIKNVENIKAKEKILNIVSSEINSNSDSNLSENSGRLIVASANKSVIPRRNPSRRISQKDEKIMKTNIEKPNVQIVNKKRQTQRKLHSTLKNKNLPLTYKNSNKNTNTSVLGKKKSSKNEKKSPNSVSHVPTKVDGRSPSSISETNVNTDLKNANLELIENTKIKRNKTQNKKRENFKNIKKRTNKAKISVDRILEKEIIENNELEQKQNDQRSYVEDESLSLLPNKSPLINSITENVQIESTMEMNVNLNTYNVQVDEFRSIENAKNSLAINSENSKDENSEKEILEKNQKIEDKIIQNIDSEEISELISTVNTECVNSKVLEQSSCPQNDETENLETKEKENIKCQQSSNEFDLNTLPHENHESAVEIEEKNEEQETISHDEQQSPINTDIEKEKESIDEKSKQQLTEPCLNTSALVKERFFIFDEITEEENLKCQINSSRKQYINMDEKICGEIIHKTREEFSINCYICWDNDNWTFKKFNDLKLFSAHLNSKHSNDQINLQNQRGNSYSLDFVNENSCVMPQSMWFGIYNEMISLKCGFAKINSNGYILYSCLVCKSNFKNFTTFTKHILGREIQEEENENCSIRQDSPKPEKDADVPMALSLFTNCNNEKNDEKINNTENGSGGIALKSFTSCYNEKNDQTINNAKNGSDVVLNSFISVNNEKCDETVNKFKNDAIALNSIINCNNEKLEETVKNIKEENFKTEFELNLENKIFSSNSKGILESILEKSKTENIEKIQAESNENILSNITPTNDSVENHIEVNQINTEQSIENLKSPCVKEEANIKSDLDNLGRPDTYGYKKITSTLFRIFNTDQDESASNKLNKILSLSLNYRDIKEKEKLELEKEKLKALLSLQKDTRPKLEGLTISTKNILDLDDKLALLTCKYCNRRYTCLTNLREHFRIHVGDRILLCHVCKRGFSKKGNLEEHIKIFHLGASDLQNIDLDALGDNRKEIARNTKITINENNPKEKGYKCQYCPRFLSNRTVLEDHLRLHLGEKPFKCEECDLQFLKKFIYDNHIVEYHTDEIQASRNNLDNFEINSYDKENSKPLLNKINRFKCEQCTNSYPTKIELIDHLYTHNNGEFKCQFCEQRFNSSKKRSYHEKLHKMNPKFECNVCNKPFPNMYGLEVHRSIHKQNALYKCRFCDHYFASESTRSIHEDIHKTGSDTKNLIQTVDIATILQMNNEQAPISSNTNTNDSNGTSSDGTDRTSNQNTTARNFMVKKIIKKIKRGKRDPNAPLDCRYCKKHFESPHQLSYHERLHEIGKKFQCNICDKIMATSYALELHLTAHLKKKNFPKGTFNNKFNGSTFLAHQLKPKIEIVSNVTLAPNQTMEILNSFFKREIPSITVTTTSEDESFQKIGVDDIEKNLTAHVLRDTDPYYQLMADFSYQYQMYQNKSVIESNEPNPAEVPELVVEGEINEFTTQKPKKTRKKKVNSITKTAEDAQNSVLPKTNYFNEENNFEKQNKSDLENPKVQLNENKPSPESDHNNKKKEKKKISPDVAKNITSVFIKCEYCNKKFNSTDKKSLNRHRRLHIAGDSHKCSFCNKCFATVYYLDKHLRVHHLNDVSEHKCKSCDLVYALKEALRRHELRAHKEINSKSVVLENQIKEELNETQDNINQINYNENISMQNNTTSNENNDQKFAIPEIPKKSNRRPRNKDQKPFSCDYCEKSFLTFNSLQNHIDRVHKKDAEDFEANYKYKCTYENCNKKFEFQANLEKHLRLHESGFKCSMCDKKTMSQILLDHHMKSHGLPTSHVCKYCTSKFTMELSRNIHERKVHSKGNVNN